MGPYIVRDHQPFVFVAQMFVGGHAFHGQRKEFCDSFAQLLKGEYKAGSKATFERRSKCVRGPVQFKQCHC